MAFSALRQCRSTMQGRSLATSSTPRFAASAGQPSGWFKNFRNTLGPNWAPIACLAGLITVVMSIGIHTAKQQICHSPGVQVTKKKRECLTEVEYSTEVLQSADKFENQSFLRKVGQIQERKETPGISPDRYTRSRECETLESVGVSTEQEKSDS